MEMNCVCQLFICGGLHFLVYPVIRFLLSKGPDGVRFFRQPTHRRFQSLACNAS